MTPDPSDEATKRGPAAGLGLATYDGDSLLEVWYPEPVLGATAVDVPHLEAGIDSDSVRGTSVRSVSTVIADLQDPPADVADAYLRLHLLSHRLVRPRSINLDGSFGILPWSHGPASAPCRLTGWSRPDCTCGERAGT